MARCFCHLNGLEVKDATARKSIDDIRHDMNERLLELQSELVRFAQRTTENESTISTLQSENDVLNGRIDSIETVIDAILPPKYHILTVNGSAITIDDLAQCMMSHIQCEVGASGISYAFDGFSIMYDLTKWYLTCTADYLVVGNSIIANGEVMEWERSDNIDYLVRVIKREEVNSVINSSVATYLSRPVNKVSDALSSSCEATLNS